MKGTAAKYWYPHHIEKYRRKTGHLTLAEHGAYRLLMDAYWDRRGPLPADETRLRKLIGADADEWAGVRVAVLAFFELTPDGWVHDKIEEQLAEADEKYAAKVSRVAAARAARAAARSEIRTEIRTDIKDDPKADIRAEISSDNVSDNVTTITNTNTNTLSKDNQEPFIARSRAPTPRGSRLSSDWQIPSDWSEDAKRLGLSEQEVRNEADRFRDYWIARTGKDGRKLDWRATWRNWCRSFLDRRSRPAGGRTPGQGYRGPTDAVAIGNRLLREIEDEESLP